MRPPESVTDAGNPIAADEWKRLFNIASYLALVMLDFSAVGNLEVCEDIVFTELSKAPKTSPLSVQILIKNFLVGKSVSGRLVIYWFSVRLPQLH